MDKILDRNPLKSEVIDSCGRMKKRMTTQNLQKPNVKNSFKKSIYYTTILLHVSDIFIKDYFEYLYIMPTLEIKNVAEKSTTYL